MSRGLASVHETGGIPYIWTATQGGAGVYRRRLEQNDTHVFRLSNPAAGFAIVVRCVSDG